MILQFCFDYHWRAGSYLHFSTVVVITWIRNYLWVNFECEIYVFIASCLTRIKAILFNIWLSLSSSNWLTYSLCAWYIQWSLCGVQRNPMLSFCFRDRVSLLCFCCTVLISFQPFLSLPPSLTQEPALWGTCHCIWLCVWVLRFKLRSLGPFSKYFTH